MTMQGTDALPPFFWCVGCSRTLRTPLVPTIGPLVPLGKMPSMSADLVLVQIWLHLGVVAAMPTWGQCSHQLPTGVLPVRVCLWWACASWGFIWGSSPRVSSLRLRLFFCPWPLWVEVSQCGLLGECWAPAALCIRHCPAPPAGRVSGGTSGVLTVGRVPVVPPGIPVRREAADFSCATQRVASCLPAMGRMSGTSLCPLAAGTACNSSLGTLAGARMVGSASGVPAALPPAPVSGVLLAHYPGAPGQSEVNFPSL